MSLELINTLGTVTTVVIVAAAAIAALVQLRHLRTGNQINAMISIGNQYESKAFRDAAQLLSHKFAAALEDPVFREYDFAVSRHLPVPTVPDDFVQLRSAINFICNTHEEIGILVKNGIIDKGLFLDRYSGIISRGWDRLERYIAFVRAIDRSDAIWENFEYLTVLSQDWSREHPSAYPKSVRRLQLHNPWPLPPLPAGA